MPAIEVLNGHELADLVGEDQLFDAADLNDVGPTEALTPGSLLTVPDYRRITLEKETVVPAERKATVTALNGQAWIDLALQQLGDEERLFELVDLNGAGITESVEPGAEIESPDFEAEKGTIVAALQRRKPSSVETVAPGDPEPEGIGYWIIENDFIVS